MSRVTAIISALVICIIVCLSWAVNHYRDNAITYKAQRDKNARELKLANAAITDMQMRQRDAAALDAKYTVLELADAKAENDALVVMMLPLVVVGCISAVCQPVREATTLSGVDNAASPRLADTAERDYFTLRERLTGYAKTTGRNPYINTVDRASCVYRWATHAIIVSEGYDSSSEYKCLIKPSNPFTNVCWVSVLTTFSAPPQILAASGYSFLLPNSRNEEMMGDGFLWCYCCRFVLNSKRLLSTSCNKEMAK